MSTNPWVLGILFLGLLNCILLNLYDFVNMCFTFYEFVECGFKASSVHHSDINNTLITD